MRSHPCSEDNYTSVWASTNGYLYLGNSSCTATTVDLFSTSVRAIAPYARDLNVNPGSITNPGRGIYVEQYNATLGPFYTRIRWKAEVGAAPANFEVTLYPSGTIKFKYNTLPSGTARVGVTPGNQIDFVAVPGYDRATVPSNAQDVTLTKQNESTIVTYAYNTLDQLTATGAISAVTYNSDGDQTSITGPTPRGTVTLGFDGRHLVTSQTANSVSTTWLIDGEDRVAKQTKGSTETRYRYTSPGDGPSWEENSSGTVTSYFASGPSGPVVTYTSGTPTFPVYNGHGSVIQTRDLSGNLVDTFTYNENGDLLSTAMPTRYGYTGQWQKDREEDSGMIRMGARFLDPLLGRFASWDPVDGGDFNAYSYAGQNPINNFDLAGTKYVEYDPQPSPKPKKNPPAPAMAKGGKQRGRHSQYENMGEDELREKYNDPNTSKAERQKIKETQKNKGYRNKKKRGKGFWGGLVAGLGFAWVWAKWLSPACGPAAPACALIL